MVLVQSLALIAILADSLVRQAWKQPCLNELLCRFSIIPLHSAPECFTDTCCIVLTTLAVSRDIFTPVCRWRSRGIGQLYLVMRKVGDKGEH